MAETAIGYTQTPTPNVAYTSIHPRNTQLYIEMMEWGIIFKLPRTFVSDLIIINKNEILRPQLLGYDFIWVLQETGTRLFPVNKRVLNNLDSIEIGFPKESRLYFIFRYRTYKLECAYRQDVDLFVRESIKREILSVTR